MGLWMTGEVGLPLTAFVKVICKVCLVPIGLGGGGRACVFGERCLQSGRKSLSFCCAYLFNVTCIYKPADDCAVCGVRWWTWFCQSLARLAKYIMPVSCCVCSWCLLVIEPRETRARNPKSHFLFEVGPRASGYRLGSLGFNVLHHLFSFPIPLPPFSFCE